MKKAIKILCFVCFGLAITLAFASQNNLKLHFANWGNEEKVISPEVIQGKIDKQIMFPIQEAIAKANPEMYMTKCFVDFGFNVDGKPGIVGIKSRTYYETSTVYGEMFINNCGNIDQICKFYLKLENDEIMVRESYLSGWTNLPDFVAKIEKSTPF